MADVKINVTAQTAQAKAALGSLDKSMAGVSTGVKGVNASMLNFNMAMQAGQTVLQIAKAAYTATAGAAIDYAAQVRDLNRVTGAGAEETSRLIQVADDMTISYGDLEQAARIASKNGIEFTTESLGRLSDQYLALNPGQERAAFLIETFGKNGLEMGKLMELGSKGIETASGAIDRNLVLTESAVQAARNFEIAEDNLSDAVLGVKISIGNALIPVLVTAANATLTLLTSTKQLDALFKQHAADVRKSSSSWEEYAAEIIRSGVESGQFTGAQVRMARAFADGTLVLSEHKDRVNELMVAVGGESEAAYNNAEANGMLDRTQEMVRDGAGEMSDAMTGAADNINAISLSDVTSMFGELTKELIFNKAAANLDAEAALALASGMGLVEPATRAAIERINTLTDKYDANRDGAIDAGEASNGYTREILGMSEAALTAGTRDPYETMSANSAAAWAAVNSVKVELESIPAHVPVTIDVTYNGQMPDQSWMDDLDNGGPVPGAAAPGGSQSQAAPGGAGSTYNVTINTAASANAVADRLKILEAYGA